ncbi:MAG: hypothetical protein KA120_01960 [Candidatus Goldbacteria bacterium]|nr:hypothetical protein [Candidatus Goldiibacteriota bacterium]HPD18119.1 hypothetical protein [Candidatus Goldiibacteriota bacterium]
MKKPGKIKISSGIERMLKDFCMRKNKNVDEFVEEAILEKIEKEEIKNGVSGIFNNNDDYDEEFIREFIMDEYGIFKKKH